MILSNAGCSNIFSPCMPNNLTVTLETLLNLGILLVQPLPPLLRQGVLVPVTGVVPGQNVDGRVQRGKAGLARNLRKSPVVADEVDHFLLEVFAEVLHAFGALGEAGGRDHVSADAGGVGGVVVGEAPVGGEFVFFRLFGDDDFGGGDGGEEDSGGGGGRCRSYRIEEVASTRLLVLFFFAQEDDGRGWRSDGERTKEFRIIEHCHSANFIFPNSVGCQVRKRSHQFPDRVVDHMIEVDIASFYS